MLPTTQLRTFEHAYRAEGPYVAAVLGRLSVPTEAVHDALQDVFVAAYHRWEDFDDSRPVRPWLTGFARKVAFRYRRSAARRSRKRAAIRVTHLDGEPTPSQRFVARDFLGRFLETLDEGHREAFVRAELEGKTAREIAQELSIGVEAVYGRVRTARKRLKVALVEDAREPSARAASLVPPWGLMLTRLSESTAAVTSTGLGLLSASSLKAMAATVVVGVLGLGAAHESVDGAHEASPRAEHVPVVHPRDVAAPSPLARAPAATAPVPEPAVVVDARVEPRTAVSAAPDVARAQPREPDAAATEQSQSVPDEVPSGAGALAQESALLRQARMLQGRGDFEAALERLDAHARRFSRGQLADGRDRLRIRVLCDLGQTTRARREAQQLARTRPDDPLAQQALSICAAP